MRKRNQLILGLVIAGVMLNQATSALAFAGPADGGFDYLNNFPAMCSEATAQHPLDGHILRMGFVAQTNFGWSFLFPDKQSREGMLERVQLLNNAGMVGQDPDEDLGEQIRFRTGANLFVVAHIFVGDPNIEPVATCVSAPMPFARFGPTYGSYYDWLSPDRFGTYLGYRRYDRWHWNKYWSFKNIRTKFRSYWGKEVWRKSDKFKRYRKYQRDHDGRFRRIGDDRPRRSDNFKKRIDRTKKPITILPITTKPDSGGDGRRKSGWVRGLRPAP